MQLTLLVDWHGCKVRFTCDIGHRSTFSCCIVFWMIHNRLHPMSIFRFESSLESSGDEGYEIPLNQPKQYYPSCLFTDSSRGGPSEHQREFCESGHASCVEDDLALRANSPRA